MCDGLIGFRFLYACQPRIFRRIPAILPDCGAADDARAMLDVSRLRAFLNRPGLEGPQQLRGYVPCALTSGGSRNYTGYDAPDGYVPMGVSGVTVATGCDLGQQTAQSLDGVGRDLLRKLAPYLGKRKRAALAALHALPLALTGMEADRVDTVVMSRYIRLSAARYDRDAGAEAFASLPWQAQAVIHSLLFQRGTGSPKNYPHTWKALVGRDWSGASERLRNGALWTGYRERRRLEGELLREVA